MMDEQLRVLAAAVIRQAVSDQHLIERRLSKLKNRIEGIKQKHGPRPPLQAVQSIIRLKVSERECRTERNRLRRFWRSDWAVDLAELAGIDGVKAREIALSDTLPPHKMRGGKAFHRPT